jgi:hypothetical protein
MAKVKIGKWEFDEHELDRQHANARRRGRERMKTEPRAVSAYYDRERDRILVELVNGCAFMFPPELAQGLADAPAEDLARIRVMPGGFALGWDKLDVHFSIAGLMAGEFGNKKWMAELKRRQSRPAMEGQAPPPRASSQKGGRSGKVGS